jgi:hypothetical protein
VGRFRLFFVSVAPQREEATAGTSS